GGRASARSPRGTGTPTSSRSSRDRARRSGRLRPCASHSSLSGKSCERILAERGTGRARLRVMRSHPMLQSPAVRSDADAASYRSLFGSLREHVRAYITKQLLLPRQEITELIRANLRAAMWFGIAAALVFLGVIALLVLLIALLALLPREWLGALVFALATGVGVAVLFAAVR